MTADDGIDKFFTNPLVNHQINSPVPQECKSGPCILGIDEAGRGPVLGPMVYSVAYYLEKKKDVLAKMKFADSKTLTEQDREKLFKQIGTEACENLGWIVKVLSPNMISNSMLRRNKYNLNAISHDSAIALIKAVIDLGISVSHVYLDTVGPPDKYKMKLMGYFPNIKITVENKADSKFPIVSASSICAKVVRDRIVNRWTFIENEDPVLVGAERGSGYPADPVTKKFLTGNLDPIFGFPTLVRFSWSTITKILDSSAAPCDFNEPDDDEVDGGSKAPVSKAQSIMTFFKKQPSSDNKGTAKGSNGSDGLMTTLPGRAKEVASRRKLTNSDLYFQERQLKRLSAADNFI